VPERPADQSGQVSRPFSCAPIRAQGSSATYGLLALCSRDLIASREALGVHPEQHRVVVIGPIRDLVTPTPRVTRHLGRSSQARWLSVESCLGATEVVEVQLPRPVREVSFRARGRAGL